MSERIPNLALFCDYENVAIGARESGLGAVDMGVVLERLLEMGNIIVKKAYADWARFNGARRSLHGVSFELIEIPHVSQSGKNSADIRLVVDALDLCYTKAHLDVFVIISGDSDFSPLVCKLRENNKTVIGVGVKSSTSDLLVRSCDDFMYYDELFRAQERRASGRAQAKKKKKKHKKSSEHSRGGRAASTSSPAPAETPEEVEEVEEVEYEEVELDPAMEHVLDTVEALLEQQGGPLWGSMVKQTIKRKRPNFSETAHGYRGFNHLLELAAEQELLVIEKDERSGGYRIYDLGEVA
ncbi:MAG: NYN domain-containing protein [Myxococcales bacterium]|nr:NYN domain-containing protein [Myxococcales bacterium]